MSDTKTEQIQLVTKDMMIGDVVKDYPQAADVMLSYGLHCVGCHVNPFESIEQGAMGHGMDDGTVTEMMSKINDAIKNSPVEKKEGITITEKAAEMIQEIAKEEGKEGFGLRLIVMPGGCAGYKYGLDFEEKANDEDKVFEKGGVQVFVDPDSLDIINGATIDYVSGLHGAGFKIENPNSKKSCGCGSSFS